MEDCKVEAKINTNRGKMSSTNIAKDSVERLDTMNSLVQILSIIGSIILIILGILPWGGSFNLPFAVVGVVTLLITLLTHRVISAFNDNIRINIEILEELRKSRD